MRLRALIALVPLTFAVLAATPATAVPSFPVLPNQYFDGVVNGKTAAAIVRTICPGPSTTQGHPVSGQTLSVTLLASGSTTSTGFTGSLGNSIAAVPVTNVANDPVVFTEYFHSSALPTSWTVPCSGTGTIAFTPLPGSPTARTDFVSVRYFNIAVTPS